MKTKENMRIKEFLVFANDLIMNPEKWHRITNKRIQIDELHNEKINHIRDFAKEQLNEDLDTMIRYSLITLFDYDVSQMMRDKNSDSDENIIKYYVGKVKDPYIIGKVIMTLRRIERFKHINTIENVSLSMGKGSKDGLSLLSGFSNESYDMFSDIRRNKMFENTYITILELSACPAYNELNAAIQGDPALFEDLLCEYHMFYRLLKPSHVNLNVEEVLKLVVKDKIHSFEMSEYINSDLSYDEFQKQCITKINYVGDKDQLFTLMNDNEYYPSKAYANDAGYDVYLPDDIVIEPNAAGRFRLELGIKWTDEMKDIAVLTFPRSSSLLDGKVFFTTGVIDHGYTGSIHLTCTNVSNERIKMEKGTRVMQILFTKLYDKVDTTKLLKSGNRGEGAFGSSGK